VLFPGRPRRGNVAIYFPGISNLWDDYNSSQNNLYLDEIQFLHYALIHAGYTADIVDDYDLAGGALQQRGYTTLYVTGPNVANDTNMIFPIPMQSPSPSIPSPQDQIKSWVHDNGGVLAVTLGGGVADEYNSSATTFDTILGLQSPRKDPRPFPPPISYPTFDMVDTITGTDSRFGSETMDISNPVDYSLIPLSNTLSQNGLWSFLAGVAAVATPLIIRKKTKKQSEN
jgi:hypothetical protein